MRKWIVLLLSLFIVGCTPYTAVSHPLPTPIPLPPTTDAIWVDAQFMANDFDISVEEAVRQAMSQESIGLLNATLEENESKTFSGLWIEQKPTYQVFVAFTKNGEKTLRPYLEEYPIPAPITVQEVAYTLAELQTLQTAVSNHIAIVQFPHTSSVNVQKNRVDLLITDEALFNETLQAAGVTLPENVELIAIYEPLAEPLAVTAVPDIHMPQPKIRSTMIMQALTIGNLEVVDGCLRIVGDHESYLVIWQTDTFLNDNNGTLEIWDRDGKVVAIVGEAIAMGGGEGPAPQDRILKEPRPAECTGPFWYMGEIVTKD